MYNHGGNIDRIAKLYNLERKQIIDFSCNTNPYGFPKQVKKTLIDHIKDIQHYPDPGYEELKETLAAHNGVDTNNVLVGNGGAEIIHLFIKTINPKKALIIAPTFVEYEKALVYCKTKINYFELHEQDNFVINSTKLKKELKNGYDLLVICNPNNPTGNFISPAIISSIIYEAALSSTKVLIDESFIDFIDQPLTNSIINHLDRKQTHVYIVRSMTKFFCIPGLRLGYGISFDTSLLATIEKYRSPWSINTFSCIAGTHLYSNDMFIQKTLKKVHRRKKELYAHVSKIKTLTIYQSAVNYFLVKLPVGSVSTVVQRKLLDNNILIRDAKNFKFLYDRFIRIAVKKKSENKILVKSLKHYFSGL